MGIFDRNDLGPVGSPLAPAAGGVNWADPITSSLLPDVDNTYYLGSAIKRWKGVFTHLEGLTADDGTSKGYFYAGGLGVENGAQVWYHDLVSGTDPDSVSHIFLNSYTASTDWLLDADGIMWLRSVGKLEVIPGTTFNIKSTLGGSSPGYVWTLQNTTTGEGAWAAAAGGITWSTPVNADIVPDSTVNARKLGSATNRFTYGYFTADGMDFSDGTYNTYLWGGGLGAEVPSSNFWIDVETSGALPGGGTGARVHYNTTVGASLIFSAQNARLGLWAADIYIGQGIGKKLYINDNSLAGASNGYVWTLQNNTTGEGAWAAAAGGGGPAFADDVFRIQDNADATKQLAFEVSGIATATTRTWTVPNVDLNFNTTTAGTFANKNLSNLQSTAVNTNILPDADGSYSLGSAGVTRGWTSIVGWYGQFRTLIYLYDNAGYSNTSVVMQRTTTPSGIANVGLFQGLNTNGNGSVPVGISTANLASASATADIYVETGNNTGAGNSGSIHLRPGAVSGGTRGTIILEAYTVPLSANAYQLGSTSLPFQTVFTGRDYYYNAGGTNVLQVSGWNLSSPSGTSIDGGIQHISTTTDFGIWTLNATNSKNLRIETGAGTNTGSIYLYAGAASGTRGAVIVDARVLRLPTAASAPASAVAGDMYYDTGTSKSYTYDGTTWNAHY